MPFLHEIAEYGNQKDNEDLIKDFMECGLEVRSINSFLDLGGQVKVEYSVYGRQKYLRKYYRRKFRENKTWKNLKLILSTFKKEDPRDIHGLL